MNGPTVPLKSPLVFDDFSGGMTDNTVSNVLNRAEKLDNFLITDNKKPKTRPGSTVLDAAAYRLATNVRVAGLVNFRKDTTLLAVSNTKLYRYSAGALTELVGPSSNPALPTSSATSRVAFSEWKNQLFMTDDAGSRVIKTYQDSGATWRLRTAGLPPLADTANYVDATVLASMIALANSLRTKMLSHYESGMTAVMAVANAVKTKFNLHRVDTLNHTVGADNAHPITSPNATDLASLLVLVNELVIDYNLHVADALAPAGRLYHPVQSVLSTSVPGITAIGELIDPPATLTAAAEGMVVVQRYYNAHDGDGGTHAGTVAKYQTGLSDPYITGHAVQDATAYAILNAAAACTDLATLKTLLAAMVSAYGKHFTDSKQGVPTVHRILTGSYFVATTDYSASQLTMFAVPSDYPSLALLLNELKLRFNTHASYASIHTFYVNVDEETSDFLSGVDTGPYFRLDPNPFYALALKLKTQYNVHVSREGVSPNFTHNDVSGAAVTAAQVPATDSISGVSTVPTTPRTLATCTFNLRLLLQKHMENIGAGTFHDAADTGNDFTPKWNTDLRPYIDGYGSVVPGDWENALVWLNTIRTHYNTHQANKVPHQNDSLFTNLDPVGTNPITLATYAYAFHYYYTYTVGTLTFETVGPVLQKEYINVIAVETQDAVISAIPVLSNSTTGNWDTASITVRIYRTTDGGNVYYKVGEITNGTTTFTDSTPDSLLVNNEVIYIDGDLPEHSPPPISKYLHIVNDTGYYLDITDSTGANFANVLQQSIPGIVDACPGSFNLPLDEPGMGVSSVKGRVIVGTTKAIYRIDGTFDESGNGLMAADRIYDADGLAAHSSFVQIDSGLLFAGNSGFYWTDGYQVTKLSTELNTTYAALLNKSSIQGTYDKTNQQVHWACQRSAGSDNDSIFTLHLRYGLTTTSCFTTWSGTSFFPDAVTVFNGQLIRGDKRGYLLKHDATYTTDPVISTTAIPSLWAAEAIIYQLWTVNTNFGQDQLRTFSTKATVKLNHESNISLQLTSNNDLTKGVKDLKAIRFHSTIDWGDSLILWGTPDLLWDYETGIVEAIRRFPAGGLRCTTKQMRLTNAKVVIWSSDATCLSTVSGGGASKSLILNDTVTYDWPTSAVGYFVAFANDSYVREYAITQVGSPDANTLTFSDAGGHAPSGSTKWVIRGKPKGEVLHLLSLLVDFQPLSTSFTPFLGGTQGENV